MHSCEPLPAPPPSGPALLQQLGRLIIRARSRSPKRSPPDHRELLKAKLKLHQPSTSQQVFSQPKPDESRPAVEAQLDSHVNSLWTEQIPMCIEVLLAPDCQECFSKLSKIEEDALFEKQSNLSRRGLLLERWTMSVLMKKNHDSPSLISPQWLVSAVRSQLHFSQLSAWLATLAKSTNASGGDSDPQERRRKLSHEKCNFKKLESNCDEKDLPKQSPNSTDEKTSNQRKLNVIYSIKIPGESYKMSDFVRQPNDHTFPITDIGNNVYLKVVLESLPRIDDVPKIKCSCLKEACRPHKEFTNNIQEEITSKMNDLTLGPPDEFRYKGSHINTAVINSNIGCNSRIDVNEYLTESRGKVERCKKDKNILDDRMHTSCRESGKHKCSCDDESDPGKEKSSTSFSTPKKLDEKRLKEIAKYKRRLRKESKLKKLRDTNGSESTGTSEGEGMYQKKLETHTSIPILQASRFDIFRAIGCYRNQTYLTLPATRFEGKSPFTNESYELPYKKSFNTVATQTDDLICECGSTFETRQMVRSEANFNLNSIIDKKCDNNVNNNLIENYNKNIRKCPDDDLGSNIVKRPKLKRFYPLVDRLDQIASDRIKDSDKSDIKDLHLYDDDTVFDLQKQEFQKRQKHSSINEDYVLYETNDYGTIDKIDGDSDNSPISSKVFEFPEPIKPCPEAQIPSPTEMDRFRYRFDSAASMVFHSKTGLPLTSSPAPLKRGNNCFDYDDSINGVSGIKSALYHPVPEPTTPVSPRPAPPRPKLPTAPAAAANRVKLGPSAGLLGTFEESALKGRLEPVATVHGFTAELGASGAFCPPHRKLPVTVFFYAPGGTNAPYLGHINLGSSGYRVSPSGTIQVSLFNPHGTLVKMFVVLYDLRGMPPATRTFLRQRTLYLPAGITDPPAGLVHKYMRYLIHLRFMTSKSGKLYLHTDIRIIVSRKADMDTAAAHSAIFKPIANQKPAHAESTNQEAEKPDSYKTKPTNQTPCRVFGGSSDFDLSYDSQNGMSYELRSFTYGPENPKFSPR